MPADAGRLSQLSATGARLETKPATATRQPPRRGYGRRVRRHQEHPPAVAVQPEAGREPDADDVRYVVGERVRQAEAVVHDRDDAQLDEQADAVEHEEQHGLA